MRRTTRSPLPSTRRRRQYGRAREHVAARHPRMEVDREEQRQVMDRFLAALVSGDVQGLMDVLAPDVVLIADSGGFAAAVRHPVVGAERVVSFLAKFPRFVDQMEISTVWLNGAPAIRIDAPPKFGMTAVSLTVANGRISRLYSMRNPHKLAGLGDPVSVSR